MNRTTLVLEAKQKREVQRMAALLGLSMGEFVRIALQRLLDEHQNETRRSKDSFLEDSAVFQGAAPADISINHDDYLYS